MEKGGKRKGRGGFAPPHPTLRDPPAWRSLTLRSRSSQPLGCSFQGLLAQGVQIQFWDRGWDRMLRAGFPRRDEPNSNFIPPQSGAGGDTGHGALWGGCGGVREGSEPGSAPPCAGRERIWGKSGADRSTLRLHCCEAESDGKRGIPWE